MTIYWNMSHANRREKSSKLSQLVGKWTKHAENNYCEVLSWAIGFCTNASPWKTTEMHCDVTVNKVQNYKFHFASDSFFCIFSIHFIIHQWTLCQSTAAWVLKFPHFIHMLGISILKSHFFPCFAGRILINHLQAFDFASSHHSWFYMPPSFVENIMIQVHGGL